MRSRRPAVVQQTEGYPAAGHFYAKKRSLSMPVAVNYGTDISSAWSNVATVVPEQARQAKETASQYASTADGAGNGYDGSGGRHGGTRY
jgi:hypothetical protein